MNKILTEHAPDKIDSVGRLVTVGKMFLGLD